MAPYSSKSLVHAHTGKIAQTGDVDTCTAEMFHEEHPGAIWTDGIGFDGPCFSTDRLEGEGGPQR